MTRKVDEKNERIKRRYAHYLREAKRSDPATVDKAMDAILRFERSTGVKSLRLFHIEQAVAFKRGLQADKNIRTGRPLSKATIDGTLRAVKAFFHWLAGQPGYKSRISYADSEYFNLSAKDARIAHTQRDVPFPTLEQCRHAFAKMPEITIIDRRNKALFAFLMLTGARDGAIASMPLRAIDLVEGCVHQDARFVKTKFAKTFTTAFFPVDPVFRAFFEAWVRYLREEAMFGHDDPLFPRPQMGLRDGSFAVTGLSREFYASAGAMRDAIGAAFLQAGLPAFGPHSFRKTLGKLGSDLCQTPEQFKAWSQNLGHESVVTTISAYCPVSQERQKQLIRGLKGVDGSGL